MHAATPQKKDRIAGLGPIGNLESSTSACQYRASGFALFVTAGDPKARTDAFS